MFQPIKFILYWRRTLDFVVTIRLLCTWILVYCHSVLDMLSLTTCLHQIRFHQWLLAAYKESLSLISPQKHYHLPFHSQFSAILIVQLLSSQMQQQLFQQLGTLRENNKYQQITHPKPTHNLVSLMLPMVF